MAVISMSRRMRLLLTEAFSAFSPGSQGSIWLTFGAGSVWEGCYLTLVLEYLFFIAAPCGK